MTTIISNTIRRPLVFLLTISLLITGMSFGFSINVHAAAESPSPVSVSVRIEDDGQTLLTPTALSVGRFDIAPFLTSGAAAFVEPTQIMSAHALIEAIYYQNYGTDPTTDQLSSPGGLTSEVENRIKEDLDIQVGTYGLSIMSVLGNGNLVMSAINNAGGMGIGSDTISDGDEIVFYPWADSGFNNLSYAYFTDSSVHAFTDTPVTLTLRKDDWGTVSPVTGASILIDGSDAGGYVTDSVNGTVTLTFDTAGDYIITASKSSPGAISRPYCKITVTDDVGLSHLNVTSLDSLGYLNPADVVPLMDDSMSYVMTVPHAQTTFSAVAIPSAVGASMSAVYAKSGEASQAAIDLTSGTAEIFDLGVGKNYCDITVEKGSSSMTYHLTVARQPALSGLDVSFLGSSDAPRSLVSSDTTKVNIANSSVTGISVTAIRDNENQTISVKYTKAGSSVSAPVSLSSGISSTLADSIATGNNIFEFTVTENSVSKIYTYIVSQIGSGATGTTVDTIIDTITSGVSTYDSDWIMAMCAAGKASSITDTEKNNYLATVLQEARQPLSTFDVGKVSKIIIALTAMGIDPRQVPDASGLPIDLVSKLSNAETIDDLGLYGIYTAPYILLAYDSGNYEVSTSAALSRSNLINYILSKQQIDSSWEGVYGVDTTAMVLPALAPYRTTSSALTDEVLAASVNTAVGNAVTWLSHQQAADGSFSNSNSTSIVILGLSALGINADTDTRFIEGNISALKDLLSYKTSDNRLGLTDTNYNAYATQQGYQALVAYRCLANNSSNGGNLYKFSPQVTLYEKWPNSRILTDILVTSYPASQEKGTKLTSADLVVKAKYKTESTQELVTLSGIEYTIGDYNYTEAGSRTVQVSYQGKTASFVITVTDPAVPVEEKTVSIRIRGANGKTLVSNSSFVIDENSTTVLDALETVLASAGYTVELNSAGTYVESIDGVGEFDLGKNSGWLYSVNGVTPPTTSASDYPLKDGDSVLWYFTEDFTKDTSSSDWSAAETEGTSTVLEAVVDSSGNATASITKEDLNKVLTEDKDSFIVSSPLATLTFDKDVIKTIVDAAAKDIKIEVAKVDISKLSDEAKAQIGSRPVYDFNITSGGKTISKLNGKVSISIPYTPSEGEDLNALVIYYINNSGTLEMIKGCKYDSTTKSIVFSTDHFSRYAIGYNAVSFTDTKGHWSEANINYLAARNIIKGKAEGKFMPNDNITRAEFITILANKAGADLQKTSESAVNAFQDVKASDWFSGAVTWGAKNNIVSGSNGKFRPNDRITRQEMAVILDRYMTNIDKLSAAATGKAVSFSDSAKIADYAKASVVKMQELGIINGKTASTFAPTDYATRAESAKMIAVLLQSTI